jgi:4-coumarate--CoA ligase
MHIQVRGFQVAPAELEGTILDNPLADDVCVVPLPDAYSGEVPLAFVVLSKMGREMIQQRGQMGEKHIKEKIMKVCDAVYLSMSLRFWMI